MSIDTNYVTILGDSAELTVVLHHVCPYDSLRAIARGARVQTVFLGVDSSESRVYLVRLQSGHLLTFEMASLELLLGSTPTRVIPPWI
jgi:hypothetical protein